MSGRRRAPTSVGSFPPHADPGQSWGKKSLAMAKPGGAPKSIVLVTKHFFECFLNTKRPVFIKFVVF